MTLLQKLQNIIDFTYDNDRIDWYKNICAAHGIHERPVIRSIDDFARLPLIARPDLSAVPPNDRVATDPSHGLYPRSTSGTSGQAPLFYFGGSQYSQHARQLYNDGCRRILYLWSSQSVIDLVERCRLEGVQAFYCDPQRLSQHVPMISLTQVDALAGPPSLLILFGRLMGNIEDRLQIRYIESTGEPGTEEAFAALNKLFPLAKIYNHYALGEFCQEIGLLTPRCDRQETGYLHLNREGVYAEAIDGELVVTHLEPPIPHPLIRYKTGDRVDWIGRDTCSCGHEGTSFLISGRHNVDFIRIAGVELSHDGIQKIITQSGEMLEPYIAVEVRQTISDGIQKVSLLINIVKQKGSSQDCDELKERLQNFVTDQLRLSPSVTLRDMVQAGTFSPITVEILPEMPINSKAPGISLKED